MLLGPLGPKVVRNGNLCKHVKLFETNQASSSGPISMYYVRVTAGSKPRAYAFFILGLVFTYSLRLVLV